MTRVGAGHKIHITGLTHNEQGYPDMTPAGQAVLVRRITEKIRRNVVALTDIVEDGVEGAEVVVVSFGITSRVVLPAVEAQRAAGKKIGVMRLRTVWPFPEYRFRELAPKVKAFVVPELNMGQMVREVERCAGATRVILVPHAGGTVHDPATVNEALVEALR